MKRETIRDPLSGRMVEVNAWGRYLTCRWCASDLTHTEGRTGRPPKSCHSQKCNKREKQARRELAFQRAVDRALELRGGARA